jgi:hypothetical protein
MWRPVRDLVNRVAPWPTTEAEATGEALTRYALVQAQTVLARLDPRRPRLRCRCVAAGTGVPAGDAVSDLPGLLRHTAAEMRRRAEPATPSGEWPPGWMTCDVPDGMQYIFGGPTEMGYRTGTVTQHDPTCDAGCVGLTQADAEHIASWHPDVAAQVADLLDTIADEYERIGPCADGCPNRGEQQWSWPVAEALARTYLRVEPPAPAGAADVPQRVPASTVEEAADA